MASEVILDAPHVPPVAAVPEAETIDLETGTAGSDGPEKMETNTSSKPSLSSIAKDLKRAAESGHPVQYESDEDDEDVHRIKFGKILQMTTAKEKGENQGNGEEDLRFRKIRKKMIARNRRHLFKTLRKYFRSAFTILVKKRRLAPSDAFQETEVLGIKLPKFAHPASFEYVDEVAKKMITLLIRNVTDGCVLHVMIEKNKTSHIIQRFVFKTIGSLVFQSLFNNDLEEEFDLEEARNMCRVSLLQILNQSDIKPILIPQFSRWSISIGLKEKFTASHDNEWMKQLWQSDPSGHYFPWKERPRNPPLPLPQEDASIKILPPTGEQSEVNVISTTSTSTANGSLVSAEPVKPKDDRSVETMNKLLAVSKPAPKMNFTSASNSADKLSGIICLPISSFPITAGLMFSVYSLEYPAPTPGPIIRSLPESFIRNCRNPAVSSRSQAQARHRANKYSQY